MTPTVKQNLQALNENIRANSPKVEQQISKSGTTPDPAIVYSVAKYYSTIEKLAKE
jgi:hypothetical protein